MKFHRDITAIDGKERQNLELFFGLWVLFGRYTNLSQEGMNEYPTNNCQPASSSSYLPTSIFTNNVSFTTN